MQAVRPRTSPLPAFGGRPQNRNAQFCSTWTWNWRSYGMLHSCWFCVYLTSWMSGLLFCADKMILFWKQIFFSCYIYFVPFVNISLVVRLTCCYLQNTKQFKRVKCFQIPKICKESAQYCFSLKLFWVSEVSFKNTVYINYWCIFCSSHPSFSLCSGKLLVFLNCKTSCVYWTKRKMSNCKS